MKIVSGEKMAEIDTRAMREYGIPGIILMENAGLKVVQYIQAILPPRKAGRVVIFCGRGNNGGDGFVIARHLRRRGYEVYTWAAAGPADYSGDAAVNYNILVREGQNIFQINEDDPYPILEGLRENDLIVDALLGTGLKRRVSGPLEDLICGINKSAAAVLSVDIPSGISASTGEVMGVAVKARYTVTFALPKRGLLIFPGAEYAGEVVVADIGIPGELTASSEIGENLITASYVKSQLPPRKQQGHKGTYGRALILAGSPGMTGAAALAGEAALKGGAGLVYVGTAAEVRPILEARMSKEVIAVSFPGDGEGNLSPAGAGEILDFTSNCQALAFGPGLAPSGETLELLAKLAREISIPLVVDAGGLGALARDPGRLKGARAPLIFTPHPGEMSGLTGLEVAQIQRKRWELARKMAREWEAVIVLKGAYTVTALPAGEIYVNPTGNPVLSTAGTGDLLTGLIVSLVAQGLPPERAAICGVYLHGLAADLLAEKEGYRGAVAGDILRFIPAALNEVAWLSPEDPEGLLPLRPLNADK